MAASLACLATLPPSLGDNTRLFLGVPSLLHFLLSCWDHPSCSYHEAQGWACDFRPNSLKEGSSLGSDARGRLTELIPKGNSSWVPALDIPGNAWFQSFLRLGSGGLPSGFVSGNQREFLLHAAKSFSWHAPLKQSLNTPHLYIGATFLIFVRHIYKYFYNNSHHMPKLSYNQLLPKIFLGPNI